MKTQAKIVRECLLLPALALGLNRPPTSSVWPVVVDSLPTAPDDVVVIYNTNGRNFGSLQRSGQQLETPGLQIRVRATTNDKAEGKIAKIVEALDGLSQKIVTVPLDLGGPAETYLVSSLDRTTSVIGLPEDPERARRSFVVNYLLSCERQV